MEGFHAGVRGSPRLVGREAAMRALVDTIEADRSVLVLGDAGIGKTALVRAGLAATGRPWLETSGYSTLDWLPYLALRRALGTQLDGDPTRVAELVEARVGPDLLVVDDVQWLDDASVAVLIRLIGRTQLILVLRTGSDASERLEAFARPGLDTVRLVGLDRAASRALATMLRPDLDRAGLARIVAEADGNPLRLEESVVAGSVSRSTARTLVARVAALPTAARHLVRLLAVADRPLPRVRIARGARAALDSGIVTMRGDALEIRHAVLAAAIRDPLDDATLVRLHRRLADVVDDPAESARHLMAAGDGRGALVRATVALDVADGPRERAALLVLAATAAAQAGSGEREIFERRVAAARALDDLADRPGVLAILPDDRDDQPPSPADGAASDGAATAAAGTDDLRAEADALRAGAAFALGRHADARAWLERAASLEIDPTGPAASRLAWETAAFMVNVDGAVAEGIAYLDRQLAGRPEDDAGSQRLVGLRDSIALLTGLPVDPERIRVALDAALASGAFARASDLARVMNVALLMWHGSGPALDFLDEEGPRFEAASAADAALDFLAEAVEVNVAAGHFADAVLAADELAERPAPPRAAQMAAIFRASALGMLGRLDQADDALMALDGKVTDDWFGRGEWLAVRAQLALWSGRPAVASDLATEVLAVPTPLVGGHILPMLTGAWGAWERGVPFETASSPIRSLAAAAPEFDGLIALADGRHAVAAERFGEAAELWRDFLAVRAMVCGWAEGEALRRAGSPEAAAARLRVELDRAETAGFEPIVARLRRSLRLAGVRVPARPRRPPPASRLTAREAEVLELVARGQTNLEIARRMGLGRPTVVRILSNAMSKLGATSRAQAVTLVGAGAGVTGAIGTPRPPHPPVSDETRSVLAMLADGLTLGQAATTLGLSRRTAVRRLAEARVVLGASRTTEAVVRARQAGWFD